MGLTVMAVTVTLVDDATGQVSALAYDPAKVDLICWGQAGLDKILRPYALATGGAAAVDTVLGPVGGPMPTPPVHGHDTFCKYW